MAFSARPTSTDQLTKLVFQSAHMFEVGTVLTFDGTNYVKALADTPVNCESPLFVSIVIDVNNFYVTQAGYCNNLIFDAPYTAGVQYYISEISPGHLTITPPSTIGNAICPVFMADSTSSGYFISNSGVQIDAAPVFPWQVATINTIMQPNNGYFVDSVSQLDMTLPATANTSDLIKIATINTGGFRILQNDAPSAQTINFINANTTAGSTGHLDLIATLGVLSGTLEIVCVATNSNFKVTNSTGNYNAT